MAGIRGRLTALAYRAGASAAQVVPFPVGDRLAHLGGRVAYRLDPGRRALVARHQRRVDAAAGDPQVRGAFDSYARYWYEMLRLPRDVRRGIIDDHFTVDGIEHLDAALAGGAGGIAAIPHLGGWEYAAAWFSGRAGRLFAVVEPVEPPELFDWFVAQRDALGIDVVPLGPGVSSAVIRALGDNRLVCLLADRDLTGDGIEVTFFGERTTLPAGPATLALRTGAPILPIAVYFRGARDHHAVIRPPLAVAREGRLRDDVARITQLMAGEFEHLIRAAPEQWHLMQPNWPSDRST